MLKELASLLAISLAPTMLDRHTFDVRSILMDYVKIVVIISPTKSN